MKIRTTKRFSKWFDNLRDARARSKVLTLMKLWQHNMRITGDLKAIGPNLYEYRIHSGPGYRVYFTYRGSEVVLLLAGGDKSSQRGDIAFVRRCMEGRQD